MLLTIGMKIEEKCGEGQSINVIELSMVLILLLIVISEECPIPRRPKRKEKVNG